MNIVVDYGNSAAKVGIFENKHLQEKRSFRKPAELRSFLEGNHHDHIIVSSVSHPAEEVLGWSRSTGKKIALTYKLPLPVSVHYATPETLGVDRIAAACGALEAFPGQDCLVIDAGTCITYEFVDHEGNYFGGGISPGIAMRFKAMHQFTSRLPGVQPIPDPPLIGDSTETAMQSGVINGVRAEVEGIIRKYTQIYPAMRSVVCGGDSGFFKNHVMVLSLIGDKLSQQDILIAPDLVLTGLDRILNHQLLR